MHIHISATQYVRTYSYATYSSEFGEWKTGGGAAGLSVPCGKLKLKLKIYTYMFGFIERTWTNHIRRIP